MSGEQNINLCCLFNHLFLDLSHYVFGDVSVSSDPGLKLVFPPSLFPELKLLRCDKTSDT